MQCPNCGQKLPEGLKFCPKCGTNLLAATQSSQPAEKQEAASQPVNQSAKQPAANQSTASQPAPKTPKKGGGKVVAIILVLLIIAAAVVFVTKFMGGSESKPEESQSVEVSSEETSSKEESSVEGSSAEESSEVESSAEESSEVESSAEESSIEESSVEESSAEESSSEESSTEESSVAPTEESSNESMEESSSISAEESSSSAPAEESSSTPAEESSSIPAEESSTPAEESSEAVSVDAGYKLASSRNGLSAVVPESVPSQDTGNGFMAISTELCVYAAYFDTDTSGAAIYSADDLKELAEKRPTELKNLLMIEKLTLENVTETQIGAADKTAAAFTGHVYDMTVEYEDYNSNGKLYLLEDGEHIGVYLVYYLVPDKAADQEKLTADGDKAIQSFSVSGNPDPEGKTYQYYTPESEAYVFLLDTDLAKTCQETDGAILVNALSFGEQGGQGGQGEQSGQAGQTAGKHIFESYVEVNLTDYASTHEFLEDYAKQAGLDGQITVEFGGRFQFETVKGKTTVDGAEVYQRISAYLDPETHMAYVFAVTESSETDLKAYDDFFKEAVWSFRIVEE